MWLLQSLREFVFLMTGQQVSLGNIAKMECVRSPERMSQKSSSPPPCWRFVPDSQQDKTEVFVPLAKENTLKAKNRNKATLKFPTQPTSPPEAKSEQLGYASTPRLFKQTFNFTLVGSPLHLRKPLEDNFLLLSYTAASTTCSYVQENSKKQTWQWPRWETVWRLLEELKIESSYGPRIYFWVFPQKNREEGLKRITKHPWSYQHCSQYPAGGNNPSVHPWMNEYTKHCHLSIR